MLKFVIQTAPFKEFPIADSSIANEYDITLDLNPLESQIHTKMSALEQEVRNLSESTRLQNYCHNLLYKVVSLNKSRIKPFLQYQCEQLTDPFVWLNKLEKLIDLNREQFTSKDHNCKLDKALVVIEEFKLPQPFSPLFPHLFHNHHFTFFSAATKSNQKQRKCSNVLPFVLPLTS